MESCAGKPLPAKQGEATSGSEFKVSGVWSPGGGGPTGASSEKEQGGCRRGRLGGRLGRQSPQSLPGDG